jgi:hypothetical protein
MDGHSRDLSRWRRAYGLADQVKSRTPPLVQTLQPVVIVDDASQLAPPFLLPNFGSIADISAVAGKQSILEIAPAEGGALVRVANTSISTGAKVAVRDDIGTLIDDTRAALPPGVRVGTQRARVETGLQAAGDLDTLLGAANISPNIELDTWPVWESYVPGNYIMYVYVGIDNVAMKVNLQWFEYPGPTENV